MKQQKVIQKVNLQEKFSLFSEYWRPKIVVELNCQEIKLVKIHGEFPWHRHETEDEMFLVWRGRFQMEFRERTIEISQGELIVVPSGIEHRPVAATEAWIILFEPAGTRNTGNIEDDRYTASQGTKI